MKGVNSTALTWGIELKLFHGGTVLMRRDGFDELKDSINHPKTRTLHFIVCQPEGSILRLLVGSAGPRQVCSVP